jgi:soluble lytic murein transglycosylase-like protein
MSAVVSVTLQKSMTRGLDVVSSIAQCLVILAGLSFLLGAVGIVFEGPEDSGRENAYSPASVLIANALASNPGIAQSVPVEPDADAATVAPRLVGMLDYVKRRYRVSPEAVLPVFEVAETIGRERRIDPLLILAIIGVESGFNPFAESAMGARGLMQVIPRFHLDKLPKGKSVRHLFDPAVNIRVGVHVLEEAIRRRGGLTAGLQSYAGSSDSGGRYAKRVLSEKARLEKAARDSRDNMAAIPSGT